MRGPDIYIYIYLFKTYGNTYKNKVCRGNVKKGRVRYWGYVDKM